MLSQEALKHISKIFCGDEKDLFRYKKGSELVDFFNNNFNKNDIYYSEFPALWRYVLDNLEELQASKKLNKFFNIILNLDYIQKDLGLSRLESANKVTEIIEELNKIISLDKYTIKYINNEYVLFNEYEDLIKIGEGGFANVYEIKSKDIILKKLKDEFLKPKFCSRFKREYQITKSLQEIKGVIKVYDFDNINYSYTMEKADKTLEDFINESTLDDNMKISLIYEILYILKNVHNKQIIHRDISDNNIFIINDKIKIADFGLGKDLNEEHSHKTNKTSGVGQYKYCAPEQINNLKEATIQSDIFSIGRIINFIMTKDCFNEHHILESISKKASSFDIDKRYKNITEIINDLEIVEKINKDREKTEDILNKIKKGIFDKEIEVYINQLNGKEICKFIKGNNIHYNSIENILFKFMLQNEENAKYIINSIYEDYEDVCKGFEDYDNFATFTFDILNKNFSFDTKRIAAKILNSIAVKQNRFHAQNLIEKLKDGVEPMIEQTLLKDY